MGASTHRSPTWVVTNCCTWRSIPRNKWMEQLYISLLKFDIFGRYTMIIHMLYAMLEFQRWGEKYVPPGVPESDDGKMGRQKYSRPRHRDR
jgi:hypothetical protein